MRTTNGQHGFLILENGDIECEKNQPFCSDLGQHQTIKRIFVNLWE